VTVITSLSTESTAFPVSSRPLSDDPATALKDATTHVDADDRAKTQFDPVKVALKWFNDKAAVEVAFVPVAERLDSLFRDVERERPDIMRDPFDVVLQDGGLRVVDSDLSEDDFAWLQQRVDAAVGLSDAASQFNRQVVLSYGPSSDVDGGKVVARRLGFAVTLHESIVYNDIADTVDGAVRFRSLLNDTRKADLPWYFDESLRSRTGGDLVQNYIKGDITTYAIGADGQTEVVRTRGSRRVYDLWL
jgi:hypothetical protein